MERITEFKFDNGDYFAAHTHDGGFRVGMNNLVAIEFPAGHPMHAEAQALTLDTVESFIDGQVSIGNIRF
jgi:hypothetical protein